MELDHLAVAGETLEAAVAHTQAALGLSLGSGGAHPRYGTHNRLIGLQDGLYLEAIAVDPEVQPQQRPRWFDLDRFGGPPRIGNWICRVPDLAAAVDALPMAGRVVQMQRGDLCWKMAVPEDGILPFDGLFPALLEWPPGVHPAKRLPQSGLRLTRLELRHPRAAELAMLLSEFKDTRVAFKNGPAGFRAEFEGPNGVRVLQ